MLQREKRNSVKVNKIDNFHCRVFHSGPIELARLGRLSRKVARIDCMTRIVLLFILVLAGFVFSQTSDRAVATYSVNEKLIGLSNLRGLSDCSVKSFVGKVKERELNGSTINIRLKANKVSTYVLVPLDRVAESDRKPILRHLITKNNTLRASGYACGPDDPISAFSIDRVY